MIAIISNPVNSTVPIFAEVLKSKGVFDEKRCVPENVESKSRLLAGGLRILMFSVVDGGVPF